MPTWLAQKPFLNETVRWRAGVFLFVMIAIGLLWADASFAHERWILTPDQAEEWNAKLKPAVYTSPSVLNISLIAGFFLFAVVWIRLGFTSARDLFPDLQARLGSYGDAVAPILRFCLAWVLISSALGFEPRYGVEPFSSPTLFAPDLELNQYGGSWTGLRWVEFVLGLGFLFGIYVRILAVALMLLALPGLALFQQDLFAYAGALVGVAIYLLLQGPGSYFVQMPVDPSLLPMQTQLAAQPRQRAQAIMRVLTGLNIFYLAVVFKIFQPNLTLGILTLFDVPILSSSPGEFTLFMALVEITCGVLITVGVMLRPLSLFFLFAFLFFAALLPESWMAHALYYGVMLSFLFNGAGHFHMPEAKDKSANIVIIGGTVAAIHAAIKIERLIGQYTRVKLTLVHTHPNMLFYPLLPEVVGGTMQPGNVVNPIRRVLPNTRIKLGEVTQVDSSSKTVSLLQKGRLAELPYDELILALFPIPNLTGKPGMMAHSSPINSVGDALHIRKRIMDLVEEAEATDDPAERKRLLSFAVIGSGQRSCATAVEICEMLNTVETSYPILKEHAWQVRLYEDSKAPFSDFEESIQSQRDRALEKAGVTLCRDKEITAITRDAIVLGDGERQNVGLVVNASFMLPSMQIDGHTYHWPLDMEDDLRFKDRPHIWVTATQKQQQERKFLTTADFVDLGETAGQNAWAASQGFPTYSHKSKDRWLKIYNMGRRSLCRIGPLSFGGTPAWLLSRVTNLAALPGLERNLRILIDWILDIPFRADIAVLTPDATERLQRVHFEPGDEVIRQDEQGDTAYIVQSGRLEVLKNERKVGELGEGDYFGEIALLQDSRRTATVRCLTPCELTVLGGEDFQSLSVGSSMMAKAIREQAEERMKA
ncbi:MAG: cyclic nucleotide-binding domain-containing protein [Proteobacteria bacterium]|nr:cyclic nucleotide-binding domain-containing protein [Pseudomonadota bacterium]